MLCLAHVPLASLSSPVRICSPGMDRLSVASNPLALPNFLPGARHSSPLPRPAFTWPIIPPSAPPPPPPAGHLLRVGHFPLSSTAWGFLVLRFVRNSRVLPPRAVHTHPTFHVRKNGTPISPHEPSLWALPALPTESCSDRDGDIYTYLLNE